MAHFLESKIDFKARDSFPVQPANKSPLIVSHEKVMC